MLALRKEHRVVTHCFGAELGDGEMGSETLGDGADFGGLGEAPAKCQRARQHEVGVSPVGVDFDRLAQALDPASNAPAINIGKADEKMPLEEEWIARVEPHCFLDMSAGLARPPEKKLHHPEVGMGHGEMAIKTDGDLEFAQRALGHTHPEQ